MVARTLIQADSLHGRVAELIYDQLYFASYSSPPRVDADIRYVSIDKRVHYEPFYTDFGPLNLSVLYRFSEYLHGLLQSPKKRKIVVYTSEDEKNRANGAYIMGAYMIIYHGVTANSSYLKLAAAEGPKFIGFRDAAMGEPTYLLHLHDVLRGIEKALSLKWFNFKAFDADEYEHYERVENGDMNWIIPGKILSFCGPHNESRVEDGYPYHAPDTYFDYFRDNNVTTIVRLNMRMYDAKKFVDAGFDHVDLFFIDGSTPSDEIVEKFIHVVDTAKGGVAVHCKAGLGRTGTLIACWMMKEFGLTAAECISWLRVCRPGSVIGPQQQWLIGKQKFCWNMSKNNVSHHVPRKQKDSGSEGNFSRLTSQVDDIRLSRPGNVLSPNRDNSNARPRPNILPIRRSKRSSDGNGNDIDETALDSQGRSQGDRLLAMKARSQHTAPAVNGVGSHNGSNGAGTRVPSSANNNIVPIDRSKIGHGYQGNYAHVYPHPAIHRLTASAALSPRFSSPTTPIKPMVSPSTPNRNRIASRNLSMGIVPPPISKVTVAAGTRTNGSRALAASTKSASTLKKVISGERPRPYPSQGTRVELAATAGYELRPRSLAIAVPPLDLPEAAHNLPANTDALLGTRRKKRC